MNGTRDSATEATHPASSLGAEQQEAGSASPGPRRQPPGAQPLPAAPFRARDPRAKSPALACVLSLMPGLGQVYVGYYQRGFVHVIVAASLIALLATGDLDELIPLAAIFLAFFWLYNIIDAGRRAALYNLALEGGEAIELPRDFKMPSFGGSIFGGLALIGFGLMMLLHTRFDLSMAWIKDWWPMAPILLGVYLLIKAVQERGGQKPA